MTLCQNHEVFVRQVDLEALTSHAVECYYANHTHRQITFKEIYGQIVTVDLECLSANNPKFIDVDAIMRHLVDRPT
jgi:hypothetical protein